MLVSSEPHSERLLGACSYGTKVGSCADCREAAEVWSRHVRAARAHTRRGADPQFARQRFGEWRLHHAPSTSTL